MEKWADKVAVVTGASSGIGAAIAKTLIKHGMTVIGLDIKIDKVEGKIYGIECDIRDQNDVEETFRMIEDKFGGVDILINNAASWNLASLMEGSPENWRKLFDTNVVGAAICNKEALKSMRSRGDNGHIIFINSIAAKMTFSGYLKEVGVYPTTKVALDGLAHSLRIELKNAKSLIGITSIYPGLVHTKMGTLAANLTFDFGRKLDMDTLPPGFLTPQDLADAIVNVLSLNSRIEIQELSLQCRGMGV